MAKVRLKNWSAFTNGGDFLAPELQHYHLQGNAYGHPKFNDGDPVNTSRIISVTDCGDHKEVETRSGSIYELYKEDVDPQCETEFPNYYDRFQMK